MGLGVGGTHQPADSGGVAGENPAIAEYEAYGLCLVPPAESIERLAETITTLRRTWTEDVFDFHGRQRRRVTWAALYDQPINQGPTKPDGPNMWEISWQGRHIEDGSLVVLEVQNSGGQHLEEGHWAVPMYFTFRDRKVEHPKVPMPGTCTS